MKKVLIVLAALCVMTTAVMGVLAVSADSVVYGDLNRDGSVNNRDLAQMQRYLNLRPVDVDLEAADVNHDGKINNRDLALLQKFLNGVVDSLDPEKPEGNDNIYNDTELDWNF